MKCLFVKLFLGTGYSTKSDEFSERFQLNTTSHPSEFSPPLKIMWVHFILSGPCTSLHIFDHVHYKKNCNIIFRKWRGGSDSIWNFSENSSDLAQLSFPYTAYWAYTVYTVYTVQTVYTVKAVAFKLLEQVRTLLETAVELLSKMWGEWSGWVMEWIPLRLLWLLEHVRY